MTKPFIEGVSLHVRDLGRVSAFYRDVIGLAVLEAGAARTVLGAGGLPFLELLHRPDALPQDGREAGLFHSAFLLPSRAALGGWLAHAAGAGQVLDGAADHLVSEAVYLRDPEGNGIEVYADRARETWRWTADRRVVMANKRLDQDGLMALATGRWSGAPAGTIIGHVHLQGGDIAQATAFCTAALGLDVTAAGPEAVFLSSGGYHHHLAVNTWNSAGAGPRDPARAGLASITLRTDAVAAPQATDPWGTVFLIHPPRTEHPSS